MNWEVGKILLFFLHMHSTPMVKHERDEGNNEKKKAEEEEKENRVHCNIVMVVNRLTCSLPVYEFLYCIVNVHYHEDRCTKK